MKNLLLFSLILIGFSSIAQTDDFENGTNDGWQNGGALETPQPMNIANGGPLGDGDNYLQLTADGMGQGGKLVVFNVDQWAGNYLERELSSISMDLKNFSGQDLNIRLFIEGGGGNYISLDSFKLSPGGDWQSATFSLAEERVSGGTNYDATFSNVTKLRIFHSDGPNSPGPNIEAVMGIDNIQANITSDVNDISNRKLPLLWEAYPNPAKGQVNFRFKLETSSFIRLDLYHSSGVLVKTLVEEKRQAGIHHILWPTNDLAPGAYICKLSGKIFPGQAEGASALKVIVY